MAESLLEQQTVQPKPVPEKKIRREDPPEIETCPYCEASGMKGYIRTVTWEWIPCQHCNSMIMALIHRTM